MSISRQMKSRAGWQLLSLSLLVLLRRYESRSLRRRTALTCRPAAHHSALLLYLPTQRRLQHSRLHLCQHHHASEHLHLSLSCCIFLKRLM